MKVNRMRIIAVTLIQGVLWMGMPVQSVHASFEQQKACLKQLTLPDQRPLAINTAMRVKYGAGAVYALLEGAGALSNLGPIPAGLQREAAQFLTDPFLWQGRLSVVAEGLLIESAGKDMAFLIGRGLAGADLISLGDGLDLKILSGDGIQAPNRNAFLVLDAFGHLVSPPKLIKQAAGVPALLWILDRDDTVAWSHQPIEPESKKAFERTVSIEPQTRIAFLSATRTRLLLDRDIFDLPSPVADRTYTIGFSGSEGYRPGQGPTSKPFLQYSFASEGIEYAKIEALVRRAIGHFKERIEQEGLSISSIDVKPFPSLDDPVEVFIDSVELSQKLRDLIAERVQRSLEEIGLGKRVFSTASTIHNHVSVVVKEGVLEELVQDAAGDLQMEADALWPQVFSMGDSALDIGMLNAVAEKGGTSFWFGWKAPPSLSEKVYRLYLNRSFDRSGPVGFRAVMKAHNDWAASLGDGFVSGDGLEVSRIGSIGTAGVDMRVPLEEEIRFEGFVGHDQGANLDEGVHRQVEWTREMLRTGDGFRDVSGRFVRSEEMIQASVEEVLGDLREEMAAARLLGQTTALLPPSTIAYASAVPSMPWITGSLYVHLSETVFAIQYDPEVHFLVIPKRLWKTPDGKVNLKAVSDITKSRTGINLSLFLPYGTATTPAEHIEGIFTLRLFTHIQTILHQLATNLGVAAEEVQKTLRAIAKAFADQA